MSAMPLLKQITAHRSIRSYKPDPIADEVLANVENLAQLYTAIKYKREDNERFSLDLLKAVRDQGFLS